MVRWFRYLQQGHIEVARQRYDLSHLRGRTVALAIFATARYPSVQLSIEVEFTSHCVSFGPKADKVLDFNSLGFDRRIVDHRGVERAFCFDRYRWSLSLPELVRSLNVEYCNFTGWGNWLVVRLLDDRGRLRDYEIYFQLRRHGANTLRMVIESAYIREPGSPGPGIPHARKGRIRFQVMAAKIARGESPRDPHHRQR
jgi:hypothetical protein